MPTILEFNALIPCHPKEFLQLFRQHSFKFSYHSQNRKDKEIEIPKKWVLQTQLDGKQSYIRTSTFKTPVVAPGSSWPKFLVDLLPSATVGITEVEQMCTTPESFDFIPQETLYSSLPESQPLTNQSTIFSLFSAQDSSAGPSLPEDYDIMGTYTPSFWQQYFNTKVFWTVKIWRYQSVVPNGWLDFRKENELSFQCCHVCCTVFSDFKMPICGHLFNDPIASSAKQSAIEYCTAIALWFRTNLPLSRSKSAQLASPRKFPSKKPKTPYSSRTRKLKSSFLRKSRFLNTMPPAASSGIHSPIFTPVSREQSAKKHQRTSQFSNQSAKLYFVDAWNYLDSSARPISPVPLEKSNILSIDQDNLDFDMEVVDSSSNGNHQSHRSNNGSIQYVQDSENESLLRKTQTPWMGMVLQMMAINKELSTANGIISDMLKKQ